MIGEEAEDVVARVDPAINLHPAPEGLRRMHALERIVSVKVGWIVQQ